MGEIVGAALVAHVPTIVLPPDVRMEINEGREISLVPGLHHMRAEVLDRLAIDTVVVLDTHWFTTVEFVVTAHERRTGRFTSDELPRGMCQVPTTSRETLRWPDRWPPSPNPATTCGSPPTTIPTCPPTIRRSTFCPSCSAISVG